MLLFQSTSTLSLTASTLSKLVSNLAWRQKTTAKGVADTALSMKDATLENGAIVKVPLFIEVGNQVRIATEDGTYVDKL